MVHSDLLLTLVAAFVAALFGGLIMSRLGLPPIVGYVLAGVVLGPYTPGGSADSSIAAELAEVGVVLLMFGVGLHFSVREIVDVGGIAVPGALGQSAIATALGLGASLLWGWSFEEGLIFGLCLSVASTVVLLRALEERNELDSHTGHVAVGWLIVEDLFTVLILVLLPVLADSADAAGVAGLVKVDSPVLKIGMAIVQAGAFVVLMLVAGRRVMPRLLAEVVRSGSRELFTLSILAIALGVSFGSAELFGVSLALGAFLAGIVLNESELSHRAGLEALPLRDAFAVLFFVSVGMIFDPSILIEEPGHVALTLAIVMAGKGIAAFLIVSGLGYGIRTGMLVAAALSQIGEFSFILAAMGRSLDLLPEEGTSLILAGAILSISLNPFMFRLMERLYERLTLPDWLTAFAERSEPETDEELSVRRHVVICGYGRSGSSLVRVLRGRNVPFVVIENDPFVLQRARAEGVPCIFGDAAVPAVLEQAQVQEARSLAVTFANAAAGPITVRNARRLNPELNVVARGVGREVQQLLREAGAAEVVDGDFEAGLEFVRHVLQRYGMDAREIVALQARWRSEYYGP